MASSPQKEMTSEVIEKLKNKLIMLLEDVNNKRNDLENSINNDSITNEEINKKHDQMEDSLRRLSSMLWVVTDKGIVSSSEDIQKYGYDPIEKSKQELKTPMPSRLEPVIKLNYNYDVTLINLRDIRFSQTSISPPFKPEIEDNISTSMDRYPFKFYNYNNNNLILLGMFGENDYTGDISIKTSHTPYVPSLNVVYFDDSNCYVSIDNRRIELIYRQLCLLLSVNPESCNIDNMMFKNTNDFLRFELGIPEEVNIYIPCSVKPSTATPPRQMKTPDGVQLEKLNKALGFPPDKIDPIYAGVIWQRVSNPPIDKYRGFPLSGVQTFPSTQVPIGTNEKLNKFKNIHLYKNKYPCRRSPDVSTGPIHIQQIVDRLIQENKIKPIDHTLKPDVVYKNLQDLYYHVANIFINHLVTGSDEFTEYVSYNTLYNNSLKFIPDFEQWKINIDKIPLYPNKTGGKSGKKSGSRKHIKSIRGGTRKRCKNGYRKNPRTKKCVKKNKTMKSKKGPHFRIGVDFGGVLAKHTKVGEENAPVTEHKNTNINMPGAVENLHKLKKKGHQLYIVSFCGKKRALEGMEEVKEKGLEPVFTEQIYIGNPWEKGSVLQKFGCNFMIDDRLDLLEAIKKKSPKTKTIWFGQTQDKCIDGQHICAETWDDVYEIINSSEYFNVPKQDININKWLAIKPKKEVKE